MSFGALYDIKILDLTQMLSGPYATQMLADQGAEVIKIEPPRGDMIRPAGPFRADDDAKTHGAYFQSVNRNKRGICLDLKTEAGKDVLKRLVRDADVLVENFRAGVMEKLGLSYETLIAENPKLVYGALRGFGDPRTGDSPYTNWPAYDVTAQAMGGLIGITGADEDSPTKIGPGLGDIIPGMMLSFGILAALHHAQKTGQGQFVDVAMTDSILAVCERIVYQHSIDGSVPKPEGNFHPFLCPFGLYPAKDGWVTIAAPRDEFFEMLAKNLGADDLLEDPRFAGQLARIQNKDALNARLCELTKLHSKAALTEMLGGLLPYGPVMTMAELPDDPHIKSREMIVEIEQPGSASPLSVAGVPVKMSETPGGVHARAPGKGEHGDEILKEASFSEAEITKLRDAGAFGQTKG